MSAAAAAAVVLISQNSTEATTAIPSKVRGPSSAAHGVACLLWSDFLRLSGQQGQQGQ